MSTSAEKAAASLIAAVYCDEEKLHVSLADGRTISTPLSWYPRLLRATPAQRANWRPIGTSGGIHWPDIDEDLHVEGMLAGRPANSKKAD